MKTVTWTKPNEKTSAVHVVRSGSKDDGYELACGGHMPPEREDVVLNPEDQPTCGNCQRAVESEEASS